MTFFKKIFGKKLKSNKTDYDPEALYMWEDDYLMIELLPHENLIFIQNETTRIDEFGEEHREGMGFNDVTLIGEPPTKTIEKLIYEKQVIDILDHSGLSKIKKAYIQGVGILTGDKAPLAYGSNKVAIMIETKGTLIQHIWINGRTENNSDKDLLKKTLKQIGSQFNFIAVDWFRTQYYDLSIASEVDKFVENSC